MRYKVYNTIEKKFIANDRDFILKPNGELCVNEYGDEIGRDDCIAVFFPSANDSWYFDAIGGIHDRGIGVDPDGCSCGECSYVSCEICPIWKDLKK